VSYRRDDSADVVGRILERLTESVGETEIFRDIDDIPLGVDFKRFIEESMSSAGRLLVVIGPDWNPSAGPGATRRLDEPNDLVRLEIEAALTRDIPIVPILVRRAEMPRSEDLPESLHPLSLRNGIRIRPDPDFDHDVAKLIAWLNQRNVSVNLVEVEELRAVVVAAEASGDWVAAKAALVRLAVLTPEYPGLADETAFADSRLSLAALAEKATRAVDDGRWSEVLVIAADICALDSDWPGLDDMESKAQAHVTVSRARALWTGGDPDAASQLVLVALGLRPGFSDAIELEADINAAQRARQRRRMVVGAIAVALLIAIAAFIVFSRGGDAVAMVPDVVGDAVDVAMADLEAEGISVTVESVSDDTVSEGIVISQDPVAGSRSDSVTIVVSSGPETVAVPDLTGVIDPEAVLDSTGLVADLTEALSISVPPGEPISQDPISGTMVLPGSTVQVVVSGGGAETLLSDCIAYNQASLRVEDQGDSGWLLTDGTSAMKILDNQSDAQAALALARRHTWQCFIGRDNNRADRIGYIVEYWAGISGMATDIPDQDCLGYEPNDLRIQDQGVTGWLLTDGRSRMLILDNEGDAQLALDVSLLYSEHCFIGRDNTRENRPSFILEYWQ
jgi:hypothetical protein